MILILILKMILIPTSDLLKFWSLIFLQIKILISDLDHKNL